LIFLIFSIILSLSHIVIKEFVFGDNIQKIALDNAIEKSKEQEVCVQEFETKSQKILYSIRELPLFKEYLDGNISHTLLKDMFLAYSKSQDTFMQLRFIDKNGVEKIRIERENPEKIPYSVMPKRLQNKSNRYYFLDSKSKELGKVWFSKLDLNKENNQLVLPYQPTIRAILPIKHKGEFGGILIINYFMKNFLKKLTNKPRYDIVVYNNQGFSLYHYDDNRSWGFYRNPKFNLSKEFPHYYKDIVSSPFVRSDSFVSKKLNTSISGGVNIIFKLKESYFQEQYRVSIHQYIWISLLIFGLSLTLTFFIITLFSRTLFNLDRLTLLNQELHNKSDELESIFETALEGIAVLDLDTKYLYCNRHYLEILEYSLEELQGKHCYDLTLPKFQQKSKEVYQKVLKEGRYENFERACMAKSGTIKFLQSSIALMPNKKSYLVTTVDISKVKEQAKEIDEYLKIINKNVIISRTDLEGNIIYISDKFTQSSGYTKEEVLGKTHQIFRHPDMEKSIYQDLWSTITKDKPWRGTLKNRRKDKSAYWINLFIFPQYNLSDEKIGYLSVRQDITEQKEIEKLAMTDTLTKIYNRRYFDKILPKLWSEAKETQEQFCLAILDVDNFKLYNDTYGHAQGDKVLGVIGKVLYQNIDHDKSYSFRIGGEEFALLCRSSTTQCCLDSIEKIRATIQKLNIKHQYNSDFGCVTISIGLVCQDAKKIDKLHSVYQEADKLLYEAKESGRNRVIYNLQDNNSKNKLK